jgi:ribA/ribD-fused uncharacterized protein
MSAIRFYHEWEEPYGCFSNFSAHPVQLKGKTWPTAEHYFQAQKFADTPDEEDIRLVDSPGLAKDMAKARVNLRRADWDAIRDDVMRTVVLAKFRQHADIKKLLLSTDNATLIEHSKNDHYWGDGGDGTGKNMLGRILMEVRSQVREETNRSGF